MGRASLCLGIAVLLQLACSGGGGDAGQGPTPVPVQPWTWVFPGGEWRRLHDIETDGRNRHLVRAEEDNLTNGLHQTWALAFTDEGKPVWQEDGRPGVHLGASWNTAPLSMSLTPGGGAWYSMFVQNDAGTTSAAFMRLRPDGGSDDPNPVLFDASHGFQLKTLTLPDGGSLLCGVSAEPGADYYAVYPWVCRLDAAGLPVWPGDFGKRLLVNPSSNFLPTQLKAGSNGTYWILGIEASHSRYLGWRVIAIDGTGRILYTVSHLALYEDGEYLVADLLPLADGGYIIGLTDHEAPGEPRSVWVGRFTAQGRAVWTEGVKEGRRLRSSGPAPFAWGFAATPEGRVVVGGLTVDETHTQSPWVHCLDANGQFAWSLDGLPVPEGGEAARYGGIFYAPRMDKDGNAYLLGQVATTGAARNESWVLKLDRDGHSVWNRGFSKGLRMGSPGIEVPLDLALSGDGGCLVLGVTEWGEDMDSLQWWLSRVSSIGQVAFPELKNPQGSSRRPNAAASVPPRGADPFLPVGANPARPLRISSGIPVR